MVCPDDCKPGLPRQMEACSYPQPRLLRGQGALQDDSCQVLIPLPFNEEIEIYLDTFSGVGLELWSMSDNIYFDNFLITDNMALADAFARETFDLKQAADASANGNMFRFWLDKLVSKKNL